ncbi:hypothetical protein GJAV_G00023540 [Gymnothorax javanicus]|nr:hypothetical protein GJAV_G00023540 [Gymnothorax javanicus]
MMDGGSAEGEVTALSQTTAPHMEPHFERANEAGQELHQWSTAAPRLRQDMNIMEQKKRVSMILQSSVFCEELETMIQEQIMKGRNPANLQTLQQIADLMSTSTSATYPVAPQGGMAALNMSLGMVSPVNDLRGSDSMAYEKGEKILRCKLAAFYRLTDLFSWSQLIYNHLTVRLNNEPEHFLIVPFGLLYSEVTASSLVKIDLRGEIVDRGSTNLGVNQAGFTLHSAIYAARPDVKCIVHIHTPAGAAVSAMKCGLLPISPEALSLGDVAYHNYQGIMVNAEEIQKNLGPKSKVLILRNRGLLSVGETVEEAFYYIHNLVTACEIQVRTLASVGGPTNLVMLDSKNYKPQRPLAETNCSDAGSHPKWQVGEQQFEALMRMLDNLGYRTGYPYRCPALREKGKKYSNAEIPVSAAGLCSGENCESSPLKYSYQRPQGSQTLRSSSNWLNKACADSGGPGGKSKVWTSVTHGRVKPLLRSLSAGVCVPSCITNCLWTKDDSARPSAVANQFVPLNTNPKEVLDMRNKIRELNLQDIKTAGPQSQVLFGAAIDRTFVQDAALSDCTETIDGLSEKADSPARSIRKGELVTGSKAIIKKEYQPCVIVNKTGPNPFKKLTDRELEEYCKEVERKQKDTKEPLPEAGKEAKDEILNRAPPDSPEKEEEGHLMKMDREAEDGILNQTPPGSPKKDEEESLQDESSTVVSQ